MGNYLLLCVKHRQRRMKCVDCPNRYDTNFLFYRARMDMKLIPLRLTLRIMLEVWFLGRRRELINTVLWRYEMNPINVNLFNYNDAEPDNSPPEFDKFAQPVRYAILYIKTQFLAIPPRQLSDFIIGLTYY